MCCAQLTDTRLVDFSLGCCVRSLLKSLLNNKSLNLLFIHTQHTHTSVQADSTELQHLISLNRRCSKAVSISCFSDYVNGSNKMSTCNCSCLCSAKPYINIVLFLCLQLHSVRKSSSERLNESNFVGARIYFSIRIEANIHFQTHTTLK